MTKKIISVLLALMMAFSLALPSLAVSEEDQKLTDAQVDDALNTAVSALVDASENAIVIVSDELADDIKDKADTPEEISRYLASFIFVEKDKVDEVADDIVTNSKYTVKVLENGKYTVYYSIDLSKNQGIYDARVFLNAIEKIQKKCDEAAIKTGIDISGNNYDPMSYSHIAGELALHMILADLSKDTASWNPISKWIYDRAGVADLNVDESRIPTALIPAFGEAVVAFLEFIVIIFG